MSVEEQQTNPLHGVKAETMVTELVEFYGWDFLYENLQLNCFLINPSISSCLTFLKKTEWARFSVEEFYLYRFKRMPKLAPEPFDLNPRERGFPNGMVPWDPLPPTAEFQ